MPATYPAAHCSPLKRQASFDDPAFTPAKHVRTYTEPQTPDQTVFGLHHALYRAHPPRTDSLPDDVSRSSGPHDHVAFDDIRPEPNYNMNSSSTSSDLVSTPTPNSDAQASQEDSSRSDESDEDIATETATQPTEHSDANEQESHTQTADKAPSNNAPVCASPKAHDLVDEDNDFLESTKKALKVQSKWKTETVGRRQARCIHKLLYLATIPDQSEALFVSGEEAARQVEAGHYFPGIILTEGQQSLPLQTTTEFLDECYDDTAKVSVQDPTRDKTAAKEVTIKQLKERFLKSSPKSKRPWNVLELAAHVEDGTRPAFLNNEDCRLLTKLKIPGSGASVSRRSFDPGWKEVEKWVLLAQGGALTEPHQDSHGYSTYITLNQGEMGFGWLSNPTQDERAAWRASGATYTGGRWRYVILRPGQTVFFPGGTVHFVFRLASAGDTLAFGGHVLRCSQIVRWVQTMLEEQEAMWITNESLTVSAWEYLERVERFVKQAQKNDQVERWGGAEAIEEFLMLKAEFTAKVDPDTR